MSGMVVPRSNPEQNVQPAVPVTMMARTESSAASCSHAFANITIS